MSWATGAARFTIGTDDAGSGPAILLLPALSSISTRLEMAPLAHELGPAWRTITADWPGFGTVPAPPVRPTPDLMRAFLLDLVGGLRQVVGNWGLAVVAAGHAAGYVVDLEARHPGSFRHLALVAPTWRGPLPTMMQGRRPVQGRLQRLIELPGLGQTLYALNVSTPVLRMMAKSHVREDLAAGGPAWLAAKRQVVARRHARFGTAAFVTGGLDPFASRADFHAALERITAPILVVYGGGGPPRSMAEMAALADLPQVRAVRLERGKLGLHEEFPRAVAAALHPFLTAARAPVPAT